MLFPELSEGLFLELDEGLFLVLDVSDVWKLVLAAPAALVPGPWRALVLAFGEADGDGRAGSHRQCLGGLLSRCWKAVLGRGSFLELGAPCTRTLALCPAASASGRWRLVLVDGEAEGGRLAGSRGSL